MAWCRLRCFERAFSSRSFHMASGSRTERTMALRVLPLPGWPRRSRTASGPSSGISQSASRDGPPRSFAPANALRLGGPKRAMASSYAVQINSAARARISAVLSGRNQRSTAPTETRSGSS